MNSFWHITTVQFSKLRVLALAALLVAVGDYHVNAQVGGDNPTGVAGAFNGQITTGCSYDAYTGNATRSCTDLAVTSVGGYPLALVRTANSRRAQSSNTANPFGVPGHWNHSYNWILEDSEKKTTQPFQPSSYTVEFPDGRVETFNSVDWDPGYYRVRAVGGDQTTAAGVRERLAPMAPPNNMIVKLYFPDGGRVEFLATLKQSGSLWYYSYVAQAIYDPYGLATSLTHDGSGRLTKVTEPAGRYLQFTYRTTTGQTHMIDKVTEYIRGAAKRIVQYNYTNISPGGQTYLALSSVGYFSQWTATYTYCIPNIAPNTGVPLLNTCDDPMYSGPMHKIAYVYRTAPNPDGSTPAYGQIQSENYYNVTMGAAVSTLAVTGTINRQETRGDGKTRTFTYGTGGGNGLVVDSGFLMTWTDFMNHGASQTYDGKKYVNSVTDRNSHKTDYTLDPITGNVTLVQFPAIATPSPAPRGTLTYEYTNTYYLWKVHDEAGNITTYTHDPTNHRVTRVDYPDGGYETFTYDANHVYQLQNHQMTTGGLESYTYDAYHRKDTYRDPDNTAGNPTARYGYDAYDRLSDVTSVLGQTLGDVNATTSYSYNLRNQVLTTTLPTDNGTRHNISNVYNDDSTLQSRIDQLLHTTIYTYDDYRRLKSLTKPRSTATSSLSYTTYYFYDTNGVGENYTVTDSNVTWVVLPSGKKTKIVYDDNRRKQSVTVGNGTGDAATTSYTYDNAGNLTVLKLPLQQSGQQWYGKSSVTDYDERNRPWRITDALNYATVINYDQFGRKSKITRPNNQVITYGDFDEMNRPRQSTASDVGTTKYTYYAGSGLVHTMQDPRLVANNSTDTYSYTYDGMGRKTSVTYPTDSYGFHRSESMWYNASGQPWLFTNRSGLTQTFTYDALNRMTGFIWSNRATPSVTFGYDADSRLTSIANTDAINNTTIATITRTYFDDDLLQSETENLTSLGGTSKAMIYNYDADGNRSSIVYPGNAYTFTYSYTWRNQIQGINSGNTGATYLYNLNGDMTAVWRATPSTTSSYVYDALDRVTHVQHDLFQDTRSFDYGYDAVGNRKWMKREDNSGDVFGYDLNDQVIACWLDIMNPDITPPGDQSIFYDGSGNWTMFMPFDWVDLYTVNNLNQYTQRTSSGRDSGSRPTPTPRPPPGTPVPRPTPRPPATATYDYAGTLSIGFDGSTYIHDAQNRLISATKDGVTMLFDYDGLNRQVSRRIGTTGARTFSVWDGWDLIEEYQSGNNVTARYLYGPNGLVKNLTNAGSYFQDGSGSTRVLTDDSKHVLEWYLYDLQGTPLIYDPNGNLRSTSAYGVRHFFTGQQWYQELGLYDLRNRFYSSDIGRFLQPDPSGFNGDASNLYRYCGNNPIVRTDPNGTTTQNYKMEGRESRGDFLDFGYWGGDGTASVYWGMTVPGVDWTGNELGMLQTEQYYASAPYGMTYTQAMNITGWGSMGGIVFPRPILKATDAHTGLYSNGLAPGAANLGGPIGGVLGGIADLVGKIWNIPNDIIGLAIGLASLPFGGEISFGENAIQFTDVPFGPGGALTLGNVQLYNGSLPTDPGVRYDGAPGTFPIGFHEQAHTYQSQLLGPLFLPIYMLNGGISASNPFENAADNWAQGIGPWFPGGH